MDNPNGKTLNDIKAEMLDVTRHINAVLNGFLDIIVGQAEQIRVMTKESEVPKEIVKKK